MAAKLIRHEEPFTEDQLRFAARSGRQRCGVGDAPLVVVLFLLFSVGVGGGNWGHVGKDAGFRRNGFVDGGFGEGRPLRFGLWDLPV